MNRRLNLTKAFGLTALTCLLGVGSATAAFRAGFALRDVTPDPLLPVSGGVGPSHPVTRTMGRLTARAKALSFHFFMTDFAVKSESERLGLTSATAITNPVSSSTA